MNNFRLTNCYEPNTSASCNRKISRSDLAFQKLKKYEEKYKTFRGATSISASSTTDKADSDSHIEQYKSLVTNCIGPRDVQREPATNTDAAKHALNLFTESEDLAVVELLENCSSTLAYIRPPVATNNKSLIINFKDDSLHLNSDGSKADTITSSFPNECKDKNRLSHKNSSNVSNEAAQQNLYHEARTCSAKTSKNSCLIGVDILGDANNTHTCKIPLINNGDTKSDITCSNIFPPDNIIHSYSTAWNCKESQEVSFNATDEMKRKGQQSQSAEHCHNWQIKQVNVENLNHNKNLSTEPESIRTEIDHNDTDDTSYEVPEISNSADMNMREKPKFPHLDTVVISRASVTPDCVSQDTDNKSATASASDNVTGDQLRSAGSLDCKRKKKFLKEYRPQTDQTCNNRNTKSTQTNDSANFFPKMNYTHLPKQTTVEDVILSSYNSLLYHYLLCNPSEGKLNNDSAISMLNKSLREQVSITRHLINSHHAVYNSYCIAARNLSKHYQPVTLQKTMEFIKQSKKKKRNAKMCP